MDKDKTRTLFSPLKSDSDKAKIILGNVLKMLSNRIYIDNKGDKHPLLNPNDKIVDDKGEYTYIIKAANKINYALKIIFHKISTIGKQSPINEFLETYNEYKKIIVAYDYGNKVADYVIHNRSQIFKEGDLLSDKLSYVDQPKFELLSPKEMEAVKKEYNINDYTTQKILKSDPMAKYLDLREGDIVRIIRPSASSGESVAYRILK